MGKIFSFHERPILVHPKLSILQSYYYNLTAGVFASNLPERPPKAFNYTGVDPLTEDMSTELGHKFPQPGEPFDHVHGHNFFIVGRGFGNFDVVTDPARCNLIDPPESNTVAVPKGAWAAILIKADNPAVWYIYCRHEEHASWGLSTGFIVQDGPFPSQALLTPPEDLPPLSVSELLLQTQYEHI
ncbi:hypothetical protein SLEP1_g33356 [Rubroshorea leprosula]|uniref:Plastocyanin-like domain-containing protein n=1 Tax=Rubroshorea leprosula TaxID=152421 RepID=A0AAV5KGK2_9ROSI|nr:hypothetical protein SLEP1_g33356 [Rubroshorea leprosula]